MISRYRRTLLTALIATTCIACAKDRDPVSNPVSDKQVSITIDLNKEFQTIDNFAASDAWACQFVGNWPEAKKNAIADLLFSQKFKADGSPEGIGLSMWRFNIGAGSAQQGEQSGIGDEWRRAESFLSATGSYDWNLQSGQLWFLKAAKERGVNQFLAFSNSPPVHFTANGKAFATAAKPNLLPEKFDAFADFLSEVIKGVQQKTGTLFNYISPVNEPQWDWSDGGQEGSPFTNADVAGITRSLNASLQRNNLSSKITVAEAGQYDFLYAANGKPDKGNQIDAFFNPASASYIANLPSVEKLICGHSYFTTSTYARAVSVRKQLAEKLANSGDLKLWQSEYCILGDNENEMKGNGRDLGIAPALYLARVVHNDLVNANASAWHWWLSVSPYDYKDGLIYIDRNKTDGAYYPSKMLWALGNFSRFVSPGAVRINASSGTADPEILVSSYKTAANKLITVVINSTGAAATLNIALSGGKIKSSTSYTTSKTKSLEPAVLSDSQPLVVEAQSITTISSTLE